METNEFKEQAEYIWNRLDDLAKTDPNAYKKFIEKQMEEHKIFNSPPEPKACIHTKTLNESSGYVFINICAWKRMPYPESDEEPIKMFAGEMSKKTAKGITEIILPVAMNDKIYQECTDSDVNRDRLYEMILNLAQDTLKMKLHPQYKKYKEIYRGDIPADARTMFMSRKQLSNEEDMEKMATGSTISSPGELIKRMSMMGNQDKANEEMRNVEQNIKIENAFESKNDSKGKANLIQDITEDDEKTPDHEHHETLPTPEYILEEIPTDGRHPARYILKVKLPCVAGVAECDLNITETSVNLTVAEKYLLSVSLQKAICEDSSAAKFNKRNKCLTVTLPLT